LGGIIERRTGRNLGQAVRELVPLDRLGLRSTWWEVNEPTPPGAGPGAHQYYGDKDTYDWNPSLDLYDGGGLLTDVRDLGQFMRLLIKGQVLQSQASLAAMTGDGTPPYRLGLIEYRTRACRNHDEAVEVEGILRRREGYRFPT
jgi:D-alanyl-D-alanine carboxypeptidase